MISALYAMHTRPLLAAVIRRQATARYLLANV